MHRHQNGRGRGRGQGRGRDRHNQGGRHGQEGRGQAWQRKLVTKLVKDKDAVFRPRDAAPFLEGMEMFESKAELVTLLQDGRHAGSRRIQDCLSMISGPESVDSIISPLLSNIINDETGRPLYKTARDSVVRVIYCTPGVVEFLATSWTACINQSSRQTIDRVADFLLVASMTMVEARSSDQVKKIASELRKNTPVESHTIHRLCAIIQLDALDSHGGESRAAKKEHNVVCWGSDLQPPGGRHDNDHSSYRDISLVPTQEELGFEGRPWLPLSSGDNALIADAEERLLDRNFRLLREDAIGTMRENMANPRPSKVWSNARIIGASCKDAFNPNRTSYLYFLVQFDLPTGKKIDWNVRRALPRDGLVALQREGESPMMASIFVRTVKANLWLDSRGGPVIGLIFHHTNDVRRALSDVSVNLSISEEYIRMVEVLAKASSPNARARVEEAMILLKGRFLTYRMTETSDSFFSYRPVLGALKQMTFVPLADDIVHLNPLGARPSYLPQYVTMPSDFGGLLCNLDEWTGDKIVESTSLDDSQAEALHQALTSRVALIQGPPGTGKTFIGGLVAQMIRDNSDESILCVCYTNHALDQFLNHMLKRGEQKIVRIGGRTKCDELKRYELKELARTKERTTSDAEHRMRVVVAKMHRCNEEMTKCLEILKEPLQWTDLDELFCTIDGNIYVNFQVPDSEGFRVAGRGNRQLDSENLFKMWKNGEQCPYWLEEMFYNSGVDFQNVWLLDHEDRLGLVDAWKQQHVQENTDTLQELAQEYQELSNEKDLIAREIDSRILDEARIVGATTTGAAKYRDLLSIKSASVVIVEEAGEVLEPHVLSALSERTSHLILIGDHKQLRPKVESYLLAKVSGHGYDLDVSLFERMILAGYPSAMLQVQHRMRPCISALIREQTYPLLQDHVSVCQYPGVKGVQDNLLFINHNNPEDGGGELEATTKSNRPEATYCVEMVRYLLLQGYKHHQITVLTPYVGQILKILQELRKLGDIHAYISELDRNDLLQEEEDMGDEDKLYEGDENKSIRCASIDNFQGEESDIVVISLVRSNKQGAIGFLKEEQRVNVLLSRAKHGMFIVGNVATLQASLKGRRVWQPLLEMLKSQGRLVDGLPTVCQIHPQDVVLCKEANDFRKHRPNGGCTLACGARLECGHACPLTCHPTDINHVLTHKQCVQPCRRIPTECPYNHPCQKLCSESCGACNAKVEDVKLLCGHLAIAPTCHSVRNEEAKVQLASKCKERLEFTFVGCGHTCLTSCANSRSEHPTCEAKCGKLLECGHHCQKKCGSCENGHSCKQRCERTLFCGHICSRACHSDKCDECTNRCVVSCIHSNCRKLCSAVCSPCVEECDWQCEHKGKCHLVCGAPCDRLPCGKRCTKLLDCGHQCPSVCGEDCPTSLDCVICCSEEKKKREVDMILFTAYDDVDLDTDPVIFLPCGHFYSMSTLDRWIELETAYQLDSNGNYIGIRSFSDMDVSMVKPKSCPDCRSVIHSVKRYGRLTSINSLRASERKHIMKISTKLGLMWESFREAGADPKPLKKLLVRVEALEIEIKQGPMLKVFQACGGAGLDVPPPPLASLLHFSRLKGAVHGKLVEKSGDTAYMMSLDTYEHAIKIALDTQSKKQAAALMMDKSRLILLWGNYSDSMRKQVLDDMVWITTNLRNIDETVVADATKLYRDILKMDHKKEVRSVLEAMNMSHDSAYGGSWNDHWYTCPNGHLYFIGNCGQAMEESRCLECGAAVGGASHRLLGTNRSAGDVVAAALGS